ncbi:MAG: bifunctional precorrin-2 dehydrogenase/sirohydrochlorin ferrochelatase [Thermodesulfovibrionales bacterium]|nr:bifunctional precorrin-2 dehydrogenase/sirohydrochlorin ferrochelatase [Thermodesulfovibrionales bacterium]
MSSYYPAFVKIKEKECVVVGGGRIAERKVFALLEAGASVTVISDTITTRLLKLSQKGLIKHIQRHYQSGDVKDCFLVIAATNDEQINKQIAEESRFLINVVDNPRLSNFIVPAVLREGDLTIAISTGGVSPALARTIKNDLKNYIHKDIKRYLKLLKDLRYKVFQGLIPFRLRNRFLMFTGSVEMLDILKQRGYKKARDLVVRRFKSLQKKDIQQT